MAAAYCRLLRFYRAQPAVQAGTLTRYPPHPDVLTCTRTLGASFDFVVRPSGRSKPTLSGYLGDAKESLITDQ